MHLSITFNFPDGDEVHDVEAYCDSVAGIPDEIARLVLERDLVGYSSLVIVAVPDA